MNLSDILKGAGDGVVREGITMLGKQQAKLSIYEMALEQIAADERTLPPCSQHHPSIAQAALDQAKRLK